MKGIAINSSPDAFLDYLTHCGITIRDVLKKPSVTLFVPEHCPMIPTHGMRKDTVFMLYADGTIGFNCFHNSCKAFTWRDVRKTIDPSWVSEDDIATLLGCEEDYECGT